MKFIAKKWSALFLLICLISVSNGLNVELSVKECVGAGAQNYPITSVVPLPEEAFQDLNSFRLTDGNNTTVPAQFGILNRRWAGDKSIANLLVNFQPTVTAFTGSGTGIAKYYLKNDGSGNSASTSLKLTNNTSSITVETGPLKFIVSKTAFNIIDQLWFDKNSNGTFADDELIVGSSNRHGGQFVGRLAGDIQYDADRTDLKFDIEESGPMRAIIRVEAVTKYNSTVDHLHGWAVRIYAYAGKPFIKIDYQLQNSAKNKVYSWPLYLQAMNLNFKLNLTGNPTVKYGLGNGQLFQRARDKGLVLAQLRDSIFGIFGTNFTDTLAKGKFCDGFMDVDDGSIGVTAFTRNFSQMWPNGLALDSLNGLSVQLWPDWCSQLRGRWPGRPLATNGLYWLFDMQHVYKEVVLNFHNTGSDAATLINFAKTSQYPPVATFSPAWCGEAKASLNMGGLVPVTTKTATTDSRSFSVTSDFAGWAYFNLKGRREETAQPGGWPYGNGKFYVSENPADYYLSESNIMGDLNNRPHSMTQYTFKNDFNFLKLGTNNTGGTSIQIPSFQPSTWRQQYMGGSKYDTAFLENTWMDVTPVDNAHFWLYHIQDAYFMTGNPWLKDWYSFTGEFRKVWMRDTKLDLIASREIAHVFDHALQSFKATGDTSIITALHGVIAGGLKQSYRPLWGQRNSSCCGAPPVDNAMQSGYMAHFLIDYMEEVKQGNPQAYADAFQIVAGLMSWNLKFCNFGSTWAPAISGSANDGSGLTFTDPQAWYYWNTGRSAYRNQLIQYLDVGILGGGKALGSLGKLGVSTNWNGEWEGRWVEFVRTHLKSDSTPPPPVTDAKLFRNGNNCTLTWTSPSDADRYHVVYGNKPIVEDGQGNDQLLNWWAAKAIGVTFKATPGSKETLTFALPDTGYPIAFAAIISFDSAANMSLLSNLSHSDSTGPSTPTNAQAAIITAQQINLTWNASTDVESKIWYYNIFRNGVKIATVDSCFYSDRTVQEQTAYQYEIQAVNGSLMESGKAIINQNTPVDNIPPSVTGVLSISTAPAITLYMSEAVDSVSAVNAANYSVNLGKSVLSATLSADKKSIVILCDSLVFGTTYTLTVTNIKDLARVPNAMSSQQVSFVFKEPFAITQTTQKFYIWDVMKIGMYCYTNGDLILTQAPSKYLNNPFLRTMNDDHVTKTADSIVAFNINKEAMVYVAYDDKQREKNRTPSWLTSKFTDTGDNLTIYGKSSTNSWVFSLYGRKYAAGSTVVLGGNNGVVDYSNYMVVVVPTDSSFIDTSVVRQEDHVINEFTESICAYPNPFNPSVQIAVQCRVGYGNVISAKAVQMDIYNLQGRKVATLSPTSVIRAGATRRYEYVWNASGYASGMYIASTRLGNKMWKKGLFLLK